MRDNNLFQLNTVNINVNINVLQNSSSVDKFIVGKDQRDKRFITTRQTHEKVCRSADTEPTHLSVREQVVKTTESIRKMQLSSRVVTVRFQNLTCFPLILHF